MTAANLAFLSGDASVGDEVVILPARASMLKENLSREFRSSFHFDPGLHEKRLRDAERAARRTYEYISRNTPRAHYQLCLKIR